MRRLAPTLLAVAVTVALAGCDTGDGKQLRPVDPDSTTTSTIAESVATGPLPSIPLEDALTSTTAGAQGAGFELFAPWQDGAPIEARNTCDGNDISPALSWSPPQAGTVELAFSLVDESAADGDGPFVHWVIAGIDPAQLSLIEGQVPVGAIQATNSFDVLGWSGPCPPSGDPAHVYRLTMYALNQQSELADGTPASELLGYLESVTVGSTILTGTYQR